MCVFLTLSSYSRCFHVGFRCVLQSYITSLLCWPIKFCTKIMPSCKKSHFIYGHFPDISIISGATADGCNAGEPSKSLVQMVSLVACDSCSQRSQNSTALRRTRPLKSPASYSWRASRSSRPSRSIWTCCTCQHALRMSSPSFIIREKERALHQLCLITVRMSPALYYLIRGSV